jgi:hypothetical protein
MQKATKTVVVERYKFKTLKSYSVEEILAAGGTAAFAHKKGITGQKQMDALKALPALNFSEEEWNELVNQMKNDK